MKTLNKNYKIIKLKSGNVVIPIIPLPKYYVSDDIILIEYDVRNIMKEISDGSITAEIINELQIRDEANNILVFGEDGRLTTSPRGFDLMTNITFSMLRNEKIKKMVSK